MSKSDSIKIRPLLAGDWPAVRTIYKEGIASGNATFEEEAPDWEAWDSAHLREARLVAEQEGRVIGWAVLAAVSSRRVYSGVAEVSLYVSSAMRGKGVGTRLLESLARESEAKGYWMLQAGIFPENSASIAVHQKCGFRIVGRRERLGNLRGRWRDVMLLERRSAITGK
jgi:L-amino acid N-acyltransferase YncA